MAKTQSTRDAYGEVLAQLGQINPDVVALDCDLSSSTRSGLFAKAFPERFFNIGIAESNMMGIAAGLARSGKIPFASTFAIFATGRAYDQIRQSIAYPGFNVKIVGSHGGLTVGPDGATHQSLEDVALMRTLPGMTVVVPCDARETELAVKAAVGFDGPLYLRLGREKVMPVLSDKDTFELGKGLVLWPRAENQDTEQASYDVCFIACGVTVQPALEAAQKLEKHGVSSMVVNMASIKPIDSDLIIKAAKSSKVLITCEEHSVIGGLGSAVCEVVSQHLPTRVVRLGVNDEFGQSGSAGELLKAYGLTADVFVYKAMQILGK